MAAAQLPGNVWLSDPVPITTNFPASCGASWAFPDGMRLFRSATGQACTNTGELAAVLGAGPVGDWFDCIPGVAGCAADGGYLNLLAADDDDGDLGDGTPHMSAIFAAFDRHGIACPTPAVQDAGCAGTPGAAPGVVATPGDRSVDLAWTAVPGASGYEVFRTEGPFGCAFGKLRIAATATTAVTDRGLRNGRTYSYVVIPKGPQAACFGTASACTPATPQETDPPQACAIFADGFESGDTSAWSAKG